MTWKEAMEEAERLLIESANPQVDPEGKMLLVQKAQVYATLAVATR